LYDDLCIVPDEENADVNLSLQGQVLPYRSFYHDTKNKYKYKIDKDKQI